MDKLTKREDQIMQIIWRLKKAFIREVIAEMAAPKPHYNTVATIIKILVKKGVLTSTMIGNTHQYEAAIEFENYREEHIVNMKKKFFGNSFPKMIAHFAKEENLSDKEREELIQLIKSKK